MFDDAGLFLAAAGNFLTIQTTCRSLLFGVMWPVKLGTLWNKKIILTIFLFQNIFTYKTGKRKRKMTKYKKTSKMKKIKEMFCKNIWDFFYNFQILKSPPVHRPCQDIIVIFPEGFTLYNFCLSYKDTPIEILTSFLSPVGYSKNMFTGMANIWRLFRIIS